MTEPPAIPAPPPPEPRAAAARIALAVAALRRALARAARRAGTLAPHTLFFGAVFQKEMRVSGRKNSTFIFRGVYALLLVGLAVLVFMASRAGSRGQSGAAAIQRLQDVAPAVTGSIFWFQIIFLPLTAAMLTGPSICDEVRNRSLPALLTTPLTAAQIIASKLAGSLVHIAILALISVPLLLGLRMFGGVDAQIILAGSAITLTSAILAGSMGLLISVFTKRSALAGSAAIGSLLLLVFLPVPLIFLLVARGLIPQSLALELVGGISSPVTLGMVLVIASGDQGPPGLDISWLWIANSLYNLLASTALVSLATVVFRSRLTGDRGEEAAGAADRPGLLARRARARNAGSASPPTSSASDAVAPAPSQAAAASARPSAAPPLPAPSSSRPVGDHPVLWRELRRQGARSSARRKGLPSAALAMALLAVLGILLPLYGAWEAWRSSPTLSLAGAGAHAAPLWIATCIFVVFVSILILLTAIRAVRRIGRGQAVLIPPRALMTCSQAMGVLLFAYWAVEGDFEIIHQMVVTIGPAIILLRAATQNAGSLAEEREARTWETLLTTRLSPREILFGKLTGALARQWDLPLVVLLHFAFAGVALDDLPLAILPHLAATMLAGIAFLSGTGLLFALLAPKGSVASILNVSLALGLWLILPIGVGLLATALEVDSDLNNALGAIMLGGQPVPLGILALRGAMNTSQYNSYGAYSIVGSDMSLGQFSSILFTVCTAYAVAGLFAFSVACTIFNRKTGRTS